MPGFAGVTLTEVTALVAGCTARVAEPTIPLSEAVTVVEPATIAVVNPVLLTDAIDGALTVQVTVALTVAVEPSLYFAMAENCCVCPDWMLALAGDTASDDRVFDPELEVLGMPWHPIATKVKAMAEIVKTDESKKRGVAFIMFF